MFGGRSLSPRSGGGAVMPVTVPKLQREMKELKLKHKEETYWLKLELDTMKREKEAVEQRMSELFRDLQELQDPALSTAASSTPNPKSSSKSKEDLNDDMALTADSDEDSSSEAVLNAKLKKYANMVKALNNQIILVRHSSEQIVKNLKDEIKDVVDASTVTERDLLTEMEKLQKENDSLKAKLKAGSASSNSIELKAQVEELQSEKTTLLQDLKVERLQSRDTIRHLRQEKTRLSEMLERMQGDVLVLRSSAEAAAGLEQIRADRDESLQALERVALLWDKADEAIQSLEAVMEELKSAASSNQEGGGNLPASTHSQPPTRATNRDHERALSTLETASLVHGQVKVALMLIELKLRNGLMSLKNDAAEVGAVSVAEPAIVQSIQTAQDDSMAAISKVEENLKLQMALLEDKSLAETKEVKENLALRMRDLKDMQARQRQLEEQVQHMSVEELGTLARDTSAAAGGDQTVQLFVSRKILERLQTEVLQVVARVKEKNETIGRLQAVVAEHKAREQTLIEELRRMMKDRGDGGPDRPTGGEFEEEVLIEEEEEEIVDEEIVDEEIILEEDEEEEEEVSEFLEEEVLETSSLT